MVRMERKMETIDSRVYIRVILGLKWKRTCKLIFQA